MTDNFNNDYRNAPVVDPSPKTAKTVPTWAWVTGGVLIVAIIALVIAVFTGGDDKSDEAASQPTPTVTITEEAPAPSVAPIPQAPEETLEADNLQTKEGFIDFVRSEYPVLEATPDSEIIDRAERACDMFDGGATFIEVIEDSVKDAKSGDEAEGYGAIVGGSVAVVCPEHYEEIAPYL